MSPSPRENEGGLLWSLRHTTPPKKKYSTHFCIRIYYLKGSLKIKILYSITNSFFFGSVNKVVLRKRGWVVPGSGSALAWAKASPMGRVARPRTPMGAPASFRHGLLGRESDYGFVFVGIAMCQRCGKCHRIRHRLCLKIEAMDILLNMFRQNKTILIPFPSYSKL